MQLLSKPTPFSDDVLLNRHGALEAFEAWVLKRWKENAHKEKLVNPLVIAAGTPGIGVI